MEEPITVNNKGFFFCRTGVFEIIYVPKTELGDFFNFIIQYGKMIQFK